MTVRPVHFVWVQGMKEPVPEIWFGTHKPKVDAPKVLFKKLLPEEECELPIWNLAKIYPSPKAKAA